MSLFIIKIRKLLIIEFNINLRSLIYKFAYFRYKISPYNTSNSLQEY